MPSLFTFLSEMKVILLLLLILPAQAMLGLAEARARLGSTDANERFTAMIEIWKDAPGSLPLLRELSTDEEPEVANRANFILRRFQMGLMPESPPALLGLAETLEQASADERTSHLTELLEHNDGAPIALALLDEWSKNEVDQAPLLLKHASLVTQSLLEQRSHWQTIFTTPLTPRCRAAMMMEVAKQDLPMKAQVIAILGKDETDLVYANLKDFGELSDTTTLESLARIAIVENRTSLALQILKESLAEAKTPDLARSLAFLEASIGHAPAPYDGPWQDELEIFRARLRGDYDEVLRLNPRLQEQEFLQYENLLLAGQLGLPSRDEKRDPFLAKVALNDLHSAFGDPPTEPDIEALSATILIDWTVLARTLTLLGSPLQAADILAANDQITSAVGLLWRSKHREEALALADQALSNFEDNDDAKMRITLTQLYLEDGEKEAARKVFEPLIYMGQMREGYARKAISLGLQLYPREELLLLAPGLQSEQAYQRAPAAAAFLPYPDKVAVTWYEYFQAKDALQTPTTLFKKVEAFLNGDRAEARQIISKELAESSKKTLLPSDSLYQNALFLQLPGSLEMVAKAAWYQLSSQDLLSVIKSDSWPEEARKEALKTALLIDPTNPVLRWYEAKGRNTEERDPSHHLTLGEASLTLQLAALTGKRESLKLAAEIVNLRDHNALRCLTILAKSHLKNSDPAEAARLLQVALCGEVAFGNQPATPIQATLENLTAYFEARGLLAEDETTAELWKLRLQAIR